VPDEARAGGQRGGSIPPHPSRVAALRGRTLGLLLAGLCAAGHRGPARAPSPDRQPWRRGTWPWPAPGSRVRLPVATAFVGVPPGKRNVILPEPRPGQASLCSVRTRTLDMALSAKIGVAQEGGTPTSALRAQERQPHGPRHPVDRLGRPGPGRLLQSQRGGTSGRPAVSGLAGPAGRRQYWPLLEAGMAQAGRPAGGAHHHSGHAQLQPTAWCQGATRRATSHARRHHDFLAYGT
jgi:hypothetical protein